MRGPQRSGFEQELWDYARGLFPEADHAKLERIVARLRKASLERWTDLEAWRRKREQER